MRREIRYAPFRSQLRFHVSEARIRGFSGPVGSGKSAALCHEALKLAYLNAGRLGLIGAPTYPMLRDSTRAAFLATLHENGVPHTFLKADNAVRLHECGSEVLFRSLEQYERLRGTNLAWFGVDELTYCREEAWSRLEARLRDPRARRLGGFAVWTPKGFDWVWTRFIGPERVPGYDAVLAAPGENTTLGDYYERLKASYDERFWRQECLGEYLPQFAGQAYYTFDRKANLAACEFDPRWPLCWSLDFNIDPMCAVIAQVADVTPREEALRGKRKRLIRVLDEIVLPDSRTVEAGRELQKRTEPLYARGLTAIEVYGDASGAARHTSSLDSDWRLLREMMRSEHRAAIQFRVPAANPSVRERVTAVTAALRSASGERALVIDPRCRELIADLEQVAWKRDAAGNARDELDKSDRRRTHISDALGYLVWGAARMASGPRPEVLL